MIDKKKFSKGRLIRRDRIFAYGMDGVGKTKFACGAPDPLVIDANKGSLKFDVSRVEVETWEETLEALTMVENGELKCGTLVLDSISDLELMSHKVLFPNSTASEHGGGYNKGDDLITPEWRRVLAQLERIWVQGKGIILVAHTLVKTFNDPNGPAYDRFEIASRPALARQLKIWSDYVFFCREEVITAKAKDERRAKSTTTGIRYAYATRTPAYDAKARGEFFPDKILLSWKAFEDAVKIGSSDVLAEIDGMLAEIGSDQLTATVKDYMAKYPQQIVESRNGVVAELEKHRARQQASVAETVSATAAVANN